MKIWEAMNCSHSFYYICRRRHCQNFTHNLRFQSKTFRHPPYEMPVALSAIRSKRQNIRTSDLKLNKMYLSIRIGPMGWEASWFVISFGPFLFLWTLILHQSLCIHVLKPVPNIGFDRYFTLSRKRDGFYWDDRWWRSTLYQGWFFTMSLYINTRKGLLLMHSKPNQPLQTLLPDKINTL